MIETTSVGTLRSSSHTILIKHIQWLLKQSASVQDETRLGFNYSVILTSAVFFESAMFSFLEQMSNGIKSSNPDNAFLIRISEKFVSECYMANGLKKYSILFETLTGSKLKDSVQDDLWESLEILFTLRNCLAHGRPLILDILNENNTRYISQHLNPSFGKVEKFLVKNKILKNETGSEFRFQDYIGFAVANWAWSTVSRAVIRVAESRTGQSRWFFNYLNSIEGVSYDFEPRIDR